MQVRSGELGADFFNDDDGNVNSGADSDSEMGPLREVRAGLLARHPRPRPALPSHLCIGTLGRFGSRDRDVRCAPARLQGKAKSKAGAKSKPRSKPKGGGAKGGGAGAKREAPAAASSASKKPKKG